MLNVKSPFTQRHWKYLGEKAGPADRKGNWKTSSVSHDHFTPSYDTDKTFPFLSKPLKITESYFILVGKSQKLSSQKKTLRKTLTHTYVLQYKRKKKSVHGAGPNFPLENDSWKVRALLNHGPERQAQAQPRFCLQNEYTRSIWAVKTGLLPHLSGETNIFATTIFSTKKSINSKS